MQRELDPRGHYSRSMDHRGVGSAIGMRRGHKLVREGAAAVAIFVDHG